jgi:hypothetical protein
MNGLGVSQALFDQFNVSLRGGDPTRRFLLKSVQDVQDALKAHGVDGSIRIAVEVISDFEDPAKTLEGASRYGDDPQAALQKGPARFRREQLQETPAGLCGWILRRLQA